MHGKAGKNRFVSDMGDCYTENRTGYCVPEDGAEQRYLVGEKPVRGKRKERQV